ncbi:MAG: universal stress protein [Microlunatus sp.]|nr:universal stress protein [Microlunatus sp.]MDN5769599.1 universal stress protein [Microlunatus sp.]
MTILVAHGPDARGPEGLYLGQQLARSGGERLVVCCVTHNRWQLPSVARVGDDYARGLSELAEQTLADAREVVGDQAEFVARSGRSVASVLLAEAEAQSARVLVCGSSADGPWGHIALGSVTDRLLHSSSVSIGLAPRGYRVAADARITRVTVSTNDTETATGVLLTAARVTHALGAPLRVVTFAVRGRTMYPPRAGLHVEDAIIESWKQIARERQQVAVRELDRFDDVSSPDEVLIADGRDWYEALDGIGWQDGEVLAIGSSREGPLTRVFVGSTAARIIRYSPVPVIVVPRTK